MALFESIQSGFSGFSPITVISAVTLGLCFVYWAFNEFGKKYPPGPPGLPVFGSVFSLVLSKRPQHEIINEWSHKYGSIFAFSMLGTRVYILSDRKLVAEAFHQSSDINDRMTMDITTQLIGRSNVGIVAGSGEVWKEQRRFFLTVFKKMDTSVIRFEDLVGRQAERFLKHVESNNKVEFDPSIDINIAIANIITEMITGKTYERDNEEFQRMIKSSNRLFDLMGPAGLFSLIPILSKIPSPMKTEATDLSRELLEIFRTSIDAHKANFDPEEPAKDFITCYLKEMYRRQEQNNPGSFDDINLEASSFEALLAGWETSTTSLSWIIYTLAAYPEAQSRVREEILDVVGSEKFPRFSDRHSMPLTEATLSECMRLRPVAAFHVPHIASHDCKIGGYDVKKGSAVTTNHWYLALSPNLWVDPHAFRPERFLDAEGQLDRKSEALPFGFGRRVCPGEQLARMEIFLFVTYLIQRFIISLPKGAPTNNMGKHGLTYKPDPYKIIAKKVD